MRRTKTIFFAPMMLLAAFQLSSLPLVAGNLPDVLPYRTFGVAVISLLILTGSTLLLIGKQQPTASWLLKIGWGMQILLIFVPTLNTPATMLTAVIGILVGVSLLAAIDPISRTAN